MSPEGAGGRDRLLDWLGADLEVALRSLGFPLYLVDTGGVVRWLNQAAVDLVGDAVGRRFVDLIAPEAAQRARQEFTAKLLGTKARTDYSVVALGLGGQPRRFEVSSVPVVRGGRVVGVFGVAFPVDEEVPPVDVSSLDQLTPRQMEVLAQLARGRTTREIAAELGIAEETVRNHVRHLLRRLGARSRLGAVLEARRRGFSA